LIGTESKVFFYKTKDCWGHFNFMNSWLQLHEFTISVKIVKKKIVNSWIQPLAFTIKISRIHDFSWNRDFVKLKSLICEVEIMNSLSFIRKFKSWIHEVCHLESVLQLLWQWLFFDLLQVLNFSFVLTNPLYSVYFNGHLKTVFIYSSTVFFIYSLWKNFDCYFFAPCICQCLCFSQRLQWGSGNEHSHYHKKMESIK
jgi:hypothetical protein